MTTWKKAEKMDIKMVQAITGIRKEETLREYLEIADTMKKEAMEKAWGGLKI